MRACCRTTTLIKNMVLLDVPDSPTASATQDFLSKMDMSRYGKYYAQLRRNVRIGVEKWPITILAAYEDVRHQSPWRLQLEAGRAVPRALQRYLM
jgi:hypothetical protein